MTQSIQQPETLSNNSYLRGIVNAQIIKLNPGTPKQIGGRKAAMTVKENKALESRDQSILKLIEATEAEKARQRQAFLNAQQRAHEQLEQQALEQVRMNQIMANLTGICEVTGQKISRNKLFLLVDKAGEKELMVYQAVASRIATGWTFFSPREEKRYKSF